MALAAGPEPIAAAAYGVNQRRCRALVNLPPEVTDVNVDQIHQGVTVVLPQMLAEVDAAHHLPGMTHQCLEDRVLLGREAESAPASRDEMAAGVEPEVLDGEQDGPG